MTIDVLEISETDPATGICRVLGNGDDGRGNTFGFSVDYNERTGKLVGGLTISPKRFYVGQAVRKVLPTLVKQRLAEAASEST